MCLQNLKKHTPQQVGCNVCMVRIVGLEPTRITAKDFESSSSADSDISAYYKLLYHINYYLSSKNRKKIGIPNIKIQYPYNITKFSAVAKTILRVNLYNNKVSHPR